MWFNSQLTTFLLIRLVITLANRTFNIIKSLPIPAVIPHLNIESMNKFGKTSKSTLNYTQPLINEELLKRIKIVQQIIDNECQDFYCDLESKLNNYTNIPWHKLHFRNDVTVLNLINNNIVSLNGIKLPNSLIGLDLRDNNIKSLNGIQFPHELSFLYLGNNSIMSINDVAFPINLKSLHLAHNKIKSFFGVEMPNSLCELDLGYNEISNLSDFKSQFKSLSELNYLDLRNNKLESLIDIEFPKSLKVLIMAKNEIQIIADVILHDKLEFLALTDNNIQLIKHFPIPESLNNLYIDKSVKIQVPSYLKSKSGFKKSGYFNDVEF